MCYLYTGCLDVSYTNDNGATWHLLENVPVSSTSYSWDYAAMPSGTYKVRVASTEKPAVFVETCDLFISWEGVKPISIDWPSPGGLPEDYTYPGPYLLSSVEIYFTCFAANSDVDISYSSDNGAMWNLITTVPGVDASYYWDYNLPVGTYEIKVSDHNNPALSDRGGYIYIQ